MASYKFSLLFICLFVIILCIKVNVYCFSTANADLCLETECGDEAECKLIENEPLCLCLPGTTGDPFKKCFYLEEEE